MEYKLTGWSNRRSLRSPSFYISPGGYRMYIRIYPRQNEDNFYVHVGVTLGDYDDKLPWPFKLKHRVNILDQMSSEVGAQEDISSRVWDPTLLCSEFNWQKPTTGDNYECVGLGFPHSVIRSRNYIRDDTIIIKLTVYLDWMHPHYALIWITCEFEEFDCINKKILKYGYYENRKNKDISLLSLSK